VEPRVQRVDRPSGVILALEQGLERSMVCSRGANDGNRADLIDRSLFDRADHLHVSGYAFLSAAQRPSLERAIDLAGERDLSVSVDPPPAHLIRNHGVAAFLDLLPSGAWLFPNRTEGELLSDASKPEAIADRLAKRSDVGAVTLGGDGALAWAGTIRERAAVEPLEAIDTTGAGDAFAGAFVAVYLSRRDLPPAVEAACSAARAHLLAVRAAS